MGIRPPPGDLHKILRSVGMDVLSGLLRIPGYEAHVLHKKPSAVFPARKQGLAHLPHAKGHSHIRLYGAAHDSPCV